MNQDVNKMKEKELINILDAKCVIKMVMRNVLKESNESIPNGFSKKVIEAYLTVMEDIERELIE